MNRSFLIHSIVNSQWVSDERKLVCRLLLPKQARRVATRALVLYHWRPSIGTWITIQKTDPSSREKLEPNRPSVPSGSVRVNQIWG
jgi:hypothetical protein